VSQPEQADSVLLSQDADLAAGLADTLSQQGLWVVGASRLASEIEWSKAYGRQVAAAAGVVIPRHTQDLTKLRDFQKPPVVKFDGLAAGKGVVVPESFEEAEEAIGEWSQKGAVLLEERLEGPEASAFF